MSLVHHPGECFQKWIIEIGYEITLQFVCTNRWITFDVPLVVSNYSAVIFEKYHIYDQIITSMWQIQIVVMWQTEYWKYTWKLSLLLEGFIVFGSWPYRGCLIHPCQQPSFPKLIHLGNTRSFFAFFVEHVFSIIEDCFM